METKIELKLCGKCIHKLEFEIFKIKMKYVKILENLEMFIKNEMSEIIDGMNKYSIEEYINKIKYYVEIMVNVEKIESDFEKAVEEILNIMFKEILQEFKIGIKSFGEIIEIKM